MKYLTFLSWKMKFYCFYLTLCSNIKSNLYFLSSSVKQLYLSCLFVVVVYVFISCLFALFGSDFFTSPCQKPLWCDLTDAPCSQSERELRLISASWSPGPIRARVVRRLPYMEKARGPAAQIKPLLLVWSSCSNEAQLGTSTPWQAHPRLTWDR